MALPAIDLFTGTDWTELSLYSANWTNNTGSAQIRNNSVLGAISTDYWAYHWNADVFNDNQYSQVVLNASVAWSYSGVSVRNDVSAATYYRFVADSAGTILEKSILGVLTQLGNTGAAIVVSDIIRIEAEGTTIRPIINGTIQNPPGAITDSSISSGSAGIAGYSDGETYIDTWEGGNIVLAPVTGSGTVLSQSAIAEGSNLITGTGNLISQTSIVSGSDIVPKKILAKTILNFHNGSFAVVNEIANNFSSLISGLLSTTTLDINVYISDLSITSDNVYLSDIGASPTQGADLTDQQANASGWHRQVDTLGPISFTLGIPINQGNVDIRVYNDVDGTFTGQDNMTAQAVGQNVISQNLVTGIDDIGSLNPSGSYFLLKNVTPDNSNNIVVSLDNNGSGSRWAMINALVIYPSSNVVIGSGTPSSQSSISSGEVTVELKGVVNQTLSNVTSIASGIISQPGATSIGSTILKRIGVSGTSYGETGWDTLTSDDLWPFPNEDRIKNELSVVSLRGFCAAGNSLDGISPLTLTTYIWEILGNQIPNDIYSQTVVSSFIPPISGTSYYADKTAIDDTGDGSIGSPKKYLQSAMALLTPGVGDSLIIKPGNYNDPLDNLLNNVANGIIGTRTVVKAETEGTVTLLQNFNYDFTKDPEYIDWYGIHWNDTNGHGFDGNDCRFFLCSWQGGPPDGNEVNFGLGANNGNLTADCLFEDCWWFGDGGRYFPLAFNSRNIIFRRCVSRSEPSWDFDPNASGGPPLAGFCSYSTENIIYQNCIGLDGMQNADNVFEGNFYIANNDSNLLLDNTNYQGCISINSENAGFYTDGNGSPFLNVYLSNCASVNASIGLHVSGPGCVIDYKNCTTVNNSTGMFKASSSAIFSTGIDCIVAGNNTDIIDSTSGGTPFQHTYFAKSGNAINSLTSEIGDQTYDVFTNGLLYIVRLEAGSPLSMNGSGTAGSIVGSIIKTLDSVTPTILGQLQSSGTVNKTLDDVTSAATGQVGNLITGTVNKTLDDTTLIASGQLGNLIIGTINIVLEGITSSISGESSIIGNLNETLYNVLTISNGQVGTDIVGTFNQVLSGTTLNGVGQLGGLGTIINNNITVYINDVPTIASTG